MQHIGFHSENQFKNQTLKFKHSNESKLCLHTTIFQYLFISISLHHIQIESVPSIIISENECYILSDSLRFYILIVLPPTGSSWRAHPNPGPTPHIKMAAAATIATLGLAMMFISDACMSQLRVEREEELARSFFVCDVGASMLRY